MFVTVTPLPGVPTATATLVCPRRFPGSSCPASAQQSPPRGPMSVLPSPTVTSRDHSWKSSTGSNLYLATFLATLCLLLFGSFAIIIRTIVMRRRLRRQLRGSYIADGMGTVRHPRHRKRRPKFCDHWIAPAVGPNWQDIMPLSLRFVLGKRSYKPEDPNAETKSEPRRFGLKTWTRPTTTPHAVTTGPHGDPEDPATNYTKLELAQISVLIEMPSLEHSVLYGTPKSYIEDEEPEHEHEGLPELVIGYARCHKHSSIDLAPNDNMEEKES